MSSTPCKIWVMLIDTRFLSCRKLLNIPCATPCCLTSWGMRYWDEWRGSRGDRVNRECKKNVNMLDIIWRSHMTLTLSPSDNVSSPWHRVKAMFPHPRFFSLLKHYSQQCTQSNTDFLKYHIRLNCRGLAQLEQAIPDIDLWPSNRNDNDKECCFENCVNKKSEEFWQNYSLNSRVKHR